jgi:signal transduction histidine kinase
MLDREHVKDFPVQQATRYSKIDFKDYGIGFSQENASQIFNIFQRLHGKAEYEGTGIGLAMCRKIVENHGGYIFATSSVAAGATFTVILPWT